MCYCVISDVQTQLCGFRTPLWISLWEKNPAAGVGLLAAATRLKPNAFHFRRQVIILQRAGGGSAERQFEELWLTWFQMNDKITVYSSSQVCVWM